MELWLKDRKKVKDFMQMLDVNEAIDQLLVIASSE